MPFIQDTHDSLPYIDLHISAQARSEVDALVAEELLQDYKETTHSLLPALPSPKFSSLVASEIERVAAKQPLTAIDVSRYEAVGPPATTDLSADEIKPKLIEAWKTTLQNAYVSSTHLHLRLQNLALLEQFGKNAWLMSNAQLEDILKRIEKELVETKQQIELVSHSRHVLQDGIRGEMDSLSEGWKKGIGRLVEVQLVVEQVRRDALLKRRQGAA
ncbi:hypothetical protein MMC11_002487 [Xylographa trunciseda]|nr:hypothetical protein [Xylographa trunciseda]